VPLDREDLQHAVAANLALWKNTSPQIHNNAYLSVIAVSHYLAPFVYTVHQKTPTLIFRPRRT